MPNSRWANRTPADGLNGTRVAHYHGIDLSQAALDLASKNLEALAFPVTLEHRDFATALHDRLEPVDVAWIGLSLHHLLAPAKLNLMREVRSVVGDGGLFLIYDNASPDAEDRDAYLLRWERHYQSLCTVLTTEEYEAMRAHVRATTEAHRVRVRCVLSGVSSGPVKARHHKRNPPESCPIQK